MEWQPTIRAVLTAVLPDDASNIDIIANDVYFEDESDPKSEWNIVWRHPRAVTDTTSPSYPALP